MTAARAAGDVFVVCLRWGDRYPAGYANRLARAVRANLATPHRFQCFTDAPEGLDPGVEARPIPDMPIPRAEWGRGIWPKLALFQAGLFPPGARVLFLDLDIMVLGPLDPFLAALAAPGACWLIREWNPALLKLLPVAWRPDRGGNSSVTGWRAGEQDHVFPGFAADPDAARARYRNDQEYLTGEARGVRYWPHDWCASFKRHCVWYWPLNLVLNRPQPPGWARVLVFHGKPDPTDLLTDDPRRRWGSKRKFGHGGVAWVKDYWRRHGEG